ncbi:hypothetical protein FACS1894167_11810 [Synergistales bacterium]|nr:hypothetical protein FACS1894167_11810 [Synergistales bacterium]
MAAGGGYCIVKPGATFLGAGWMVSVLLLVSGADSIAVYFAHKDESTLWELVCGIVTVLAALILLSNGWAQLFTDIVLIYIFAGWMTLVGVLRVMAALKLKSAEFSWGWVMTFGVLSLMVGGYSFLHPVVAAFTIGFLIGVWILTHGLNMIAFGVAIGEK